jgi:leader peptidase (prepilin peptidase) / N-methyltransferase
LTALPYVLAVLAGLIAGWVANVLAERFPVVEKPLFGPLRCVRSGEKLQFRDYLPVVGYVLQKGRCRHCGKTLPWRFPLVEILLPLAFAFAWPTYEAKPLYFYLVNAFYIFLLATIALIDWRYHLIYPVMIWGGCGVGLIVALLSGPHPDNLLPDGLSSVALGAGLGGGMFYLIYLVALAIYRRRALGFGDVLLAILIGVILGFPRAVSALFLGAVLGGVVAIGFYFFGRKRWRDFIPYGTTLCLGVILIIIWGEAIWHWGPFALITDLLQLFFLVILKVVFNQ